MQYLPAKHVNSTVKWMWHMHFCSFKVAFKAAVDTTTTTLTYQLIKFSLCMQWTWSYFSIRSQARVNIPFLLALCWAPPIPEKMQSGFFYIYIFGLFSLCDSNSWRYKRKGGRERQCMQQMSHRWELNLQPLQRNDSLNTWGAYPTNWAVGEGHPAIWLCGWWSSTVFPSQLLTLHADWWSTVDSSTCLRPLEPKRWAEGRSAAVIILWISSLPFHPMLIGTALSFLWLK